MKTKKSSQAYHITNCMIELILQRYKKEIYIRNLLKNKLFKYGAVKQQQIFKEAIDQQVFSPQPSQILQIKQIKNIEPDNMMPVETQPSNEIIVHKISNTQDNKSSKASEKFKKLSKLPEIKKQQQNKNIKIKKQKKDEYIKIGAREQFFEDKYVLVLRNKKQQEQKAAILAKKVVVKPKLQMIKHDEVIFDYEGKGAKGKDVKSKNLYENTAKVVGKLNKDQQLKRLFENKLEADPIKINKSKEKNDELKKSNKQINSAAANDFFSQNHQKKKQNILSNTLIQENGIQLTIDDKIVKSNNYTEKSVTNKSVTKDRLSKLQYREIKKREERHSQLERVRTQIDIPIKSIETVNQTGRDALIQKKIKNKRRSITEIADKTYKRAITVKNEELRNQLIYENGQIDEYISIPKIQKREEHSSLNTIDQYNLEYLKNQQKVLNAKLENVFPRINHKYSKNQKQLRRKSRLQTLI